MVAAAADSYGGTSAADTVNQLRSDGYNVESNLDRRWRGRLPHYRMTNLT
jgi:hypothetical protein